MDREGSGQQMFKISERALDYALLHLLAVGDTDVLPPAFEFEAIAHDWVEIRKKISGQDLDTYTAGSPLRYLAPKSSFGFRQICQLDPMDSIILTALVFEIGSDIEGDRVGTPIVHSYRFEPNYQSGRLFSTESNYTTFEKRSIEIAETSDVAWVVRTDIADFFPRLYFHRLEGILARCCESPGSSSPTGSTRVLIKLIKAWNQNVSYGVPVGIAATRLLAEATIGDIDRILINEGVTYVRFSDDFRIFCKTEAEANRTLALLADSLSLNHGLTLNAAKTSIQDVEGFLQRYGLTEEDSHAEGVDTRVTTFLAERGLTPYDVVINEALTPEELAELESLSLVELLTEELNKAAPDQSALRTYVHYIGQLGIRKDEGAVLRCAREHPSLFTECVSAHALQWARMKTPWHISKARQLFDLLDHPRLGHLPFHRTWILHFLWRHGPGRVQAPDLVPLGRDGSDEATRRSLALVLGRADEYSWFRLRKQAFVSMSPWERRAFLIGAECLPGDECDTWRSAVQKQLSPLEQTVVKWRKTGAPSVPASFVAGLSTSISSTPENGYGDEEPF